MFQSPPACSNAMYKHLNDQCSQQTNMDVCKLQTNGALHDRLKKSFFHRISLNGFYSRILPKTLHNSLLVLATSICQMINIVRKKQLFGRDNTVRLDRLNQTNTQLLYSQEFRFQARIKVSLKQLMKEGRLNTI